MCLGVPGKVLQKLDNGVARVDVHGNQTDISIKLTPEVEEGQFVLIHAGFAMEIVDEEVARETISYMEELGWYDN
ncbi:MAG: HypC/HybG/HupF family hydrogenase formation chaperone [Syntrophomonadaceae bacterium]|nr:HypC/HybG/HupF family hydrogenase formation chaperone [Syntrophomonadaceae bacterium]